MDTSYESSGYGRTPGTTPLLPNDSGYITATPSPFCDASPNTIRNDESGKSYYHGIRNTPIGNQKFNKKASLRKYLLNESYSSTILETNVQGKEDNASDSQCLLCLPVINDDESYSVHPILDGNQALTECLCQLKVVDDSFSDINFSANQRLLSTTSGNVSCLPNSKNKLQNSLSSVTAKKFKSGSNVCLPFVKPAASTKSTSFRWGNYVGTSRLDFLVHLSGRSGCFPGIVSKILSYLSSQDLVTVCMVSSEWRKVCVADPIANSRRLVYVRQIRHSKENVSWKEFKQSNIFLNTSISSHKGIFREIQNTDGRISNSSPPPLATPHSPPVSPSKVRFTMFVKAGVALDEGECLVRCPRCSHPSQASYGHACCQAVGCQYTFCLMCLCDSHEGLPCPTRSAIPARRRSSCVGSKESRRNLRRL